MADVEDLRSASEEEEESEDEYAYESEASTDPVADAGDQLDLDVARCCARFGDESAERSTTKGSRTLIVTLKIDPTRSQASAETRQAWGMTAPLSAKLVFSGGATQYASGYCDAGIAVTAPDACIVGRQIERLLETFWRNPVHAAKRQSDSDGLLCATLVYAHERMGSLADVCAICDARRSMPDTALITDPTLRSLAAYVFVGRFRFCLLRRCVSHPALRRRRSRRRRCDGCHSLALHRCVLREPIVVSSQRDGFLRCSIGLAAATARDTCQVEAPLGRRDRRLEAFQPSL